MYQFRVKKTDIKTIEFLDSCNSRNKLINDLVAQKVNKEGILTIKEIKEKVFPIFLKRGIKDIYLFGSYARGEATIESDVDIFCEKGSVKTLLDQISLEEEIKKSLGKEVDLVFETSSMSPYFESELKKDLIKLC